MSSNATSPTPPALAEHMHLVHQIVARFVRRLPASVQRDDLVAAGTFGLFQALQSTTHTCPGMFIAYARTRIRGAILDELRRHDWSPRRHRPARASQSVNASAPPPASSGSRQLPNGALLRSVKSVAPLEALTSPPTAVTVVGFDDLPIAVASALEAPRPASDSTYPGASSPEAALATKWRYEALHAALAELPERERTIIRMRYFEGMTSKAIASMLALSEARVSQLHARATARLRQILLQREELELAA